MNLYVLKSCFYSQRGMVSIWLECYYLYYILTNILMSTHLNSEDHAKEYWNLKLRI